MFVLEVEPRCNGTVRCSGNLSQTEVKPFAGRVPMCRSVSLHTTYRCALSPSREVEEGGKLRFVVSVTPFRVDNGSAELEAVHANGTEFRLTGNGKIFAQRGMFPGLVC